MEIQNIRLGIIQVCVVVVQAVALGFYIGGVKSDIKILAETTKRIEDNQSDDKKNQREFENATGTTISDLRTRLALIEAKQNKR